MCHAAPALVLLLVLALAAPSAQSRELHGSSRSAAAAVAPRAPIVVPLLARHGVARRRGLLVRRNGTLPILGAIREVG